MNAPVVSEEAMYLVAQLEKIRDDDKTFDLYGFIDYLSDWIIKVDKHMPVE